MITATIFSDLRVCAAIKSTQLGRREDVELLGGLRKHDRMTVAIVVHGDGRGSHAIHIGRATTQQRHSAQREDEGQTAQRLPTFFGEVGMVRSISTGSSVHDEADAAPEILDRLGIVG